MAGPARTAIWSPEAIADLDTIWSYYERVASTSVAAKIVREINHLVASIEAYVDARAMSCDRESDRWRPNPMSCSIAS